MKIQILTGKGLDIYYAWTFVGFISLKYSPLLLLLVRVITICLNPFGWFDNFIGIYLRWRGILLLDSDIIGGVSYVSIAN